MYKQMGRPKRAIGKIEQAALKKALKHFGSMSEMALQLEVTRQAIAKWRYNGIPWHQVTQIEKLSKVPRWRLRPDLWKKPAALK